MPTVLTTEDAVRRLRADPTHAELVYNTYLDRDVVVAAHRFSISGEWQATLGLLHGTVCQAKVVDLGAGNGMASRAFVLAGASEVFAVEPDCSVEIGRGAIERTCAGLPVRIIAAMGEALTLPSGVADIVYARQVLHHTRDLRGTLRECARVLKPGGIFIACREHVADTEEELNQFLASHPVHQLTHGENAFALADYRRAIEAAALRITKQLGPWDSVINAFPAVNNDSELATFPAVVAKNRFGWAGRVVANTPVLRGLLRRRLFRPRPGRLYSFVAAKP